MFYNQDLLSFRSGTFGKIWVLAHNPKKLKARRDFANIVVAKKCYELLEYFPFCAREARSEHGLALSLRVCSHLMFGIVIVYYKECDFLYQDAQKLMELIKLSKGHLKEASVKKGLKDTDFMIEVPTLPEYWELEFISPTEHARFLDQMERDEREQNVVLAPHTVSNLNDITLQEDYPDPRLKSSSVFWPKEEGLHPDDQPLTEEQIQEQWKLMNNTDNLFDILNPASPRSSRPQDPEIALAEYLNQPTELSLLDVPIGVTEAGNLSGDLRGERILRESEGRERFSESDFMLSVVQENRPALIDLANQLNNVTVSDQDMLTTIRSCEVSLPRLDLYNDSLSVTVSKRHMDRLLFKRTSESLFLDRTDENDSVVRSSESQLNPPHEPTLVAQQSDEPQLAISRSSRSKVPSEVESVKSAKRRIKLVDAGPIQMSSRAIKECLVNYSDLCVPFEPPHLVYPGNKNLMSVPARARQLGKELTEMWKNTFEHEIDVSLGEFRAPEVSSVIPSVEGLRQEDSGISKNGTANLDDQSKSLVRESPQVAPANLPDGSLLIGNQEVSAVLGEGDTLRTIAEGRETSVVDPLPPLDVSAISAVNGQKDFSVDLDSSLTANRNDDLVLNKIQSLTNLDSSNSSVLFSQLCPKGVVNRRKACRLFYALLQLANQERVGVVQNPINAFRRANDPILITPN